MQAHLLVRSCTFSGLRGESGAPGPPQPYPDSFVWGVRCGGRRGLRRPPKAPPQATKGRLEPRTAPPVPGLRESYRGELRGTWTQTRVTPRASAFAPRPTAPARTASRSPQEPPPPPPLHKMAAGPLCSSRFQKGRDKVVYVMGGTAQAHWGFRAYPGNCRCLGREKLRVLCMRLLRMSPALREWRWAAKWIQYLARPLSARLCKLLHFLKLLQ